MITAEKNGDTCRVAVNDKSLKLSSADELKNTVCRLIDDGIKTINLDLAGVEYIDSSGVGKILFIYKKLKNCDGKFKITGISPALYELFDALALTALFNIEKK
ncbi:MAG: hypothetical protein A2096_11825 [Spirochaetes bacterium GWF1_41_5]|nr:MAG: hypothetical protein A2096_11825 [Spirochaetes bacterium GWF1_41_5]